MSAEPSDAPIPPPLLPGARWLFPLRYLLLAVYLLAICGCCAWLAMTDNQPVTVPWEAVLLIVGIFGVLQAAFLTGLPHFRWPRPTGRRPMWISVTAGAFLAALLSAALCGTAVSFFRAENSIDAIIRRLNGYDTRLLDIAWPYWAFLGIHWLVWLLVFSVGYAGQWLRRFRWIYRTLIAGTWLELLITIPVDAAVRKR